MKMVETELKKIIKKDREKDKKKDSSKYTEEPEEEDTEEPEEEVTEELEEEVTEELEEEDTKEYEEEDIDNTDIGKLETIWYDPWSYNEFEKLFWDFFEKLSSLSLGDEELSTAIISYGKELVHKESLSSPVTSSYMAQLKLSLPSEGDDLNDLKELISKKLVEKRIHVVVFVDDIDRLLPNEIQFIFKLTRQIADFDNVIYIMGFDPNVVSHVLKKGYGSLNFGKAYMEKMIQVPIVLPVIQEPRLKKYLVKQLKGLVELNSIIVSDDRISGIVDKLSFAFKTKRSIIRYINQLSFVIPLLKNETYFEDLCLTELLKFLNDQGWMKIYEKRNELLKTSNNVLSQTLDKTKEAEIKSVAKYFTRYSAAVQDILSVDLFPDTKISSSSRRINNPLFFSQYFLYAHPDGLIPEEDVKKFMEIVLGGSVDNIKVWFNNKNEAFGIQEIERAVIFTLDTIQANKNKKITEDAASIICQALSYSNLTNGFTYHSDDKPNSLDETIGIYLIQEYLGHRVADSKNEIIVNKKKFNSLIRKIYKNAPLNFCLNLNKCIYDYSEDELYSWNTYSELVKRVKMQDIQKIFFYSYDIQLAFLHVWKKKKTDKYLKNMRDIFSSKDFNAGLTVRSWLVSLDYIPEQLRHQKKKTIIDLLSPLNNEFIDNVNRNRFNEDEIIADFTDISNIKDEFMNAKDVTASSNDPNK